MVRNRRDRFARLPEKLLGYRSGSRIFRWFLRHFVRARGTGVPPCAAGTGVGLHGETEPRYNAR